MSRFLNELYQNVCKFHNRTYEYIHYHSTVILSLKDFLHTPRLTNLFDQTYKNSNIVKYYYDLKFVYF